MSARVIITRPVLGAVHMQVCATSDATDVEILDVCNRENPSGTSAGWTAVIRKPDGSMFQTPNTAPKQCAEDPSRTHFLVIC